MSTSYFVTIVLPMGHSDIDASFKCCSANGIPIIVTKHATAERRCPIASHQPANMNQTALPIQPKGLVPMSIFDVNISRSMASFPKGKNEKRPITKHAFAHGIPTIEINARAPTSHQAKPMIKPPQINQMILPNERIINSLFSCSGQNGIQFHCFSSRREKIVVHSLVDR